MLFWLASTGPGTTHASKPDILDADPGAGCPAIDRPDSVNEHEVRMWWRLVPEAETTDLQAVEIRLPSPPTRRLSNAGRVSSSPRESSVGLFETELSLRPASSDCRSARWASLDRSVRDKLTVPFG